MARRFPSKLYKYVPAERIDILQNASMRFTPPAFFNDPFEMSPCLNRVLMASDVEQAGGVAEAFARAHAGHSKDKRHAESLSHLPASRASSLALG